MIDLLRMLVEQYGYLAVAVGCFFEGETTVILGVLAASQGLITYEWAFVAAFAGTVAGDNMWLWLGRYLGRPFIRRRAGWQNKAEQVQRLMDRYGALVLIGFRFFYGLRSITPFMLGAARTSPLRFFVFDAIGAVLWLAIVSSAAYFLSAAVEELISGIQSVEKALAAGLAVVVAFIWLVLFIRRRVRRRYPPG